MSIQIRHCLITIYFISFSLIDYLNRNIGGTFIQIENNKLNEWKNSKTNESKKKRNIMEK